MPKGNPLYPVRLDFFVTLDARLKAIGISYLMGLKGQHAPAARKLLDLGIKQYIDNLTPKQKADFEFIMQRVRIAEDPKSLGGLVDDD